LKETRKIIRFPAEKKEWKREYQEGGNKFRVTSTLLKDMKNIFFNISNRQYLLKEEPDRFVANIDIKICAHDEAQDEDVQIGEALAFFVKSDFSLEYGSLFRVMSAHSQTLADVYSVFFKESDQQVNRLDEYGAFGTNMLFIDYLCLHPNYRGSGLGRPMLMGIIEETSCGAEVVIIEPVPVRFEDEEKNAKLRLPYLSDEEHEIVRRKLRDFWNPLGFAPIEGNDRFLVLPLSLMHPSVKELLNEIPGNRKTDKQV
jgi:GNAT superfamily N-acetyltransferase